MCLDGIRSDDLKNIMDYIYNGEVQIFQENLDRFLTVAQRFKLEGLMENNYEPPEQDSVPMEDKVDAKEEDYIVEATQMVKKKVLKNQKSKEVAAVDKIVVPISSTDVNDVRKTVQQYIETDSNGKLKCTICGKEAVGKDR